MPNNFGFLKTVVLVALPLALAFLQELPAHVEKQSLQSETASQGQKNSSEMQSNADSNTFVNTVTQLQKGQKAVSWISATFYSSHLSGKLIPNETIHAEQFPLGSVPNVALMTHLALIISGSPYQLKQVSAALEREGFGSVILPGDFMIAFPKFLLDEYNREIFLLLTLTDDADEFLKSHQKISQSIAGTVSDAHNLDASFGVESRQLGLLNSQAAALENDIKAAHLDQEQLNHDLSGWVQKLNDAGGTMRTEAVRSQYDPSQDLGRHVAESDPYLSNINNRGIPIHQWDGHGNGVSIPYLDNELADKLSRFFADNSAKLKELKLGNLQVEGAARTPEGSLSLRDSGNGWAVNPFNTNHLLGTSCDLSGVNLKDPNTFDAVKQLLEPYGIELGTKGRNGTFDPVHATLKDYAAPNSKARLQRTEVQLVLGPRVA